MIVFSVLVTFTIASFAQARKYIPQTPEYLKCQYGKYYKDVGKPPSCNPFGQSCPPPYFCRGGPADERGYCCKTENPCKAGNPYTRNGDAPNCLGVNAVRCARGYTCVGSTTSYSVCCKGCSYRGKSYFPYEQFLNSEGQECTCGQNGQVTCTVGYPIKCNYKGREYNNGEIFKDGCQSCKCSNGQVSCREERCAYCYYNGKKYQEGENFPATDGCNTCTCGGNGSVGCTKIGCPKFCFYNGQKYSVGQKFPATDGCNTCTCESTGGISCTEMACNPGGYTG